MVHPMMTLDVLKNDSSDSSIMITENFLVKGLDQVTILSRKRTTFERINRKRFF